MLPWILCSCFFITTLLFGYQTYKFAKIILEIQDAMEDSLEIINVRIASISKVLEIPLFYDSPEIRRVHEDLRASKEAMLRVAQTFSTVEEGEEKEEALQ